MRVSETPACSRLQHKRRTHNACGVYLTISIALATATVSSVNPAAPAFVGKPELFHMLTSR